MEQNYFILHEKKGKFKTTHRKNEEKCEFESLGVSPYVLKGVPKSCFDPNHTITHFGFCD